MPILRRAELQRYFQSRFGRSAEVVAFGPIGKPSTKKGSKRYGYGAPIAVTYKLRGAIKRAVLGTMSPGPFGHEHMADRAQAMLWDYESYARLPRHVKALDVGIFTKHRSLKSVAEAEEFFVLSEWQDGTTYNVDLERLADEAKLRDLDRRRVRSLAGYLATIHRVKRRDPPLYRRRLRELIGHGECIMGLTDSYPDRYHFITGDLLRTIEEACNQWRWRLRDRAHRLSQVHGDFHPWNILFREGVDFSLLDRSRGEWGEPADDVTSLTMNFLLFSLQRWGRLQGPFEVLLRTFWDTYLARSRDAQVLEASAPFFAFRGLVVASPLWYPDLSLDVRRKIFRFIENVLDVPRFDPAHVNRYCGE